MAIMAHKDKQINRKCSKREERQKHSSTRGSQPQRRSQIRARRENKVDYGKRKISWSDKLIVLPYSTVARVPQDTGCYTQTQRHITNYY